MKNKLYKQLAVCGIDAVRALAKYNPQKVNKLYFDETRAKEFGSLCSYMSKNKKPYNIVPKADLQKLCESIHNQGVVAIIDIPTITPLTKQIAYTWEKQKQISLILDNVGNANNVGAIIRSAVFFGINNIVLPISQAKELITTSSYRVAQGAMEFINIYSIKSLSTFLQDTKGKIISVAATLNTNTPVGDLPKLLAEKPCVLILGNEETGIEKQIETACDYKVVIKGNTDKIQSLNVAQSASVLFYVCTQHIHCK